MRVPTGFESAEIDFDAFVKRQTFMRSTVQEAGPRSSVGRKMELWLDMPETHNQSPNERHARGALDGLGCPLSKLQSDRQIVGDFMTFYQKTSDSAAIGRVETPATNRGFLIGLSGTGGHRRTVFKGNSATDHDFGENSVYVRDFSEHYKADLRGSFDFVLLEVTNAALARIADREGESSRVDLSRGVHDADPVLAGLLGALFSTSPQPSKPSALFIDQMSVAIGTHILQRYGAGEPAPPGRRYALSSRRVATVVEMIDSRLNGNISIDNLASACGLSSAVFTSAFRETTGKTPHQWLMKRRVEKSRGLLLNSNLSLVEIARSCGFTDQSHFTRIFARETGTPPGAWRRNQRY
ncbi:AraC family transcriptional regulator [Mesorhizobium sp. M2A.F.Ca.ET.043.05.1.1]|uniref:AraC family transcriptional regulator n=1 Tax=Mesorhizobium sp. M2A.F.Ca.ET.043.05.1.1 TaxID=2493671 RepID=UPI001FE087C3|nr:AraC family transcriptional regulator [Mesorhizobium sp. M2A.F.Ca.ET.043.05.1.1]